MASKRGGGWSDEVWTVALSAPFILCFIPGLQDVAKQGFLILRDTVPEWYQAGFGAGLAFAFGRERVSGIVGKLLARRR